MKVVDREVPLDRHLRRLRRHGGALSAATASAITKTEDICPPSRRGIEQTKRACRCCSSSSPPRKSRSPCPNRSKPCSRPDPDRRVQSLDPRRPLDERGRCREGHGLDAETRRHVSRRALRASAGRRSEGRRRRCRGVLCRGWASGDRQPGTAMPGRWAHRPTSATQRSRACQAPDFTLPDVDGKPRTLSEAAPARRSSSHLWPVGEAAASTCPCGRPSTAELKDRVHGRGRGRRESRRGSRAGRGSKRPSRTTGS